MRLFIAIQLNREIKASLSELQEILLRRGVRGNFTSLENLQPSPSSENTQTRTTSWMR